MLWCEGAQNIRLSNHRFMELIFVQNDSLGLASDFINVDSVISFLCTSCTIP